MVFMTFVRKSGKHSRQHTLAHTSLAISVASILVLIRTILYYVLSCAAPCGVSLLGVRITSSAYIFSQLPPCPPPPGPLSTSKAILRSLNTSKNRLLLYFTDMQGPSSPKLHYVTNAPHKDPVEKYNKGGAAGTIRAVLSSLRR